ncbi:MAG: PAAR domain-containing protein [Pseudomonadota bacterium]
MPNVIRMNDSTSHGGRVVSTAASHYIVGGAAVACMGDKCTCPQHGSGVIVEGDPKHTVDGRAVAYHGHKTSCGATLIATTSAYGHG